MVEADRWDGAGGDGIGTPYPAAGPDKARLCVPDPLPVGHDASSLSLRWPARPSRDRWA